MDPDNLLRPARIARGFWGRREMSITADAFTRILR